MTTLNDYVQLAGYQAFERVLIIFYQIDHVLHPLLKTSHPELPNLKLHRLLLEPLMNKLHGCDRRTLFWKLANKILMMVKQALDSRQSSVGSFFEMDHMFCKIMQADEVLLISP